MRGIGLEVGEYKKEKAGFSRLEADFGDFKALAHRTAMQL